MKTKEYLINLWDKIKFDESGQFGGYGYGGLSAPAKKYTPAKALSYYKANIPSLAAAVTTATKTPSYGGSVSPIYQYPNKMVSW